MRKRNKNLAGPPTLLRKAAQPETLRRLAGCAGREVDDLAALLFGCPLFVGQRKICRNVKHNQFRHHILLAGDPKPSGSVLKEPPQKSVFPQAHISLSFYISGTSKLNAIYTNTETKGEFLTDMREKTQVSLSNVRFSANKLHLSRRALPACGQWRSRDRHRWAQRTKVRAKTLDGTGAWTASPIGSQRLTRTCRLIPKF